MTSSFTASQTEFVTSAPAHSGRRKLSLMLLVAIWAAIYFTSLFQPALLDDADTVHAVAARMMTVRHERVTLYTNGGIKPFADGVRYLEKAPLPYWLVAASYQLFGVSEWSTRLPIALAVLALALLLLRVGGRIYGEEAGFYSALVILTSFGVYLFTRFFIPDIIVGLWLTAGMAFFWRTLEESPPSRLACWGLAVTIALNVLTKGLIGLAFPAGIIFIFLLLTGNLRHLLRLRLLSSAAIFLIIAAPWHILAGLRNPAAGQSRGFFWFYFINEHVKRFLGTRYPKDYDTVPLWLFWGLLLVWLLPWSAFLPQAVAQVRVRLRNATLDAGARANLLFGIWALLIFLFFSLSTRQEYYIVPALPALALLIGGWLGRESTASADATIRRSGRISSAILSAVGVLIFAATVTLVFISKPPAPGTDIAVLLQQHPQDYALSMGHFLDLTPQVLGAFRAPLLVTGMAFLLGTGLSWFWRRRGKLFAANLALAAMMVGFLYCAHLGLMIFSPVISSKGLAEAISHEYRPGDVIVINGEYAAGSSINFYTGVQVRILNHVTANLWYGSLFPDAPKIFENDESFRNLWNSPTRVFLWTETNNIPTRLLRNPMYSIAQRGGKLILSNQPSLSSQRLSERSSPIPQRLHQ